MKNEDEGESENIYTGMTAKRSSRVRNCQITRLLSGGILSREEFDVFKINGLPRYSLAMVLVLYLPKRIPSYGIRFP